jgi:ribulose-bisphosphate carboxylase large chain
MISASLPTPVTGSRFRAVYQVLGDEKTARSRAEDICIEETIEFPAELVPEGSLREHVFGHVESFEQTGHETYRAVISFADEITGFELPQLINVLFGNISMKPGVRLLQLDLSAPVLSHFKGPRFGIDGIRSLTGATHRPLLSTAIKPMGLSVTDLAQMAYQLALGGMDIIKDDHGLNNQPFAPFKERVTQAVKAIGEANAKTGYKTMFFANIAGPAESLLEQIHFAKEAGADGLMLIPGHCGLDFMRRVAEDDSINMPIMAHPAFVGSYVLNPTFGVSHRVMHGEFLRLAGADFAIFPNYIGRFASYSREDCIGIDKGCKESMSDLRSIFPAPGGGISVDAFADMLEVFGRDVAYLMSSNLHRESTDLTSTVKRYRELLEKI